ncbi:MAG: hypothetical protein QMD08_07815 [Actinomycetota bacterium]|nr:hypothetical protein [Actinomycetota bacterium]
METPRRRYQKITYLFLLLGLIIAFLSAWILFMRGMNVEAAAQLLFIPILFGALYYGWKGGVLSALLAGALYVGVIIFSVESEIIQSVAVSVGLRLVFFAFLGVAGGLLFERYRAEIKELEEKILLDKLTGLYTCRYFITALRDEIDRAKRYGDKFTVVTFKIAEVGERGSLSRKIMSKLGDVFKAEVRIVDVAALTDTMEISALLPETAQEGANVFVKRLREKINATFVEMGVGLPSKEGATVVIYVFPEDEGKLEDLLAEYAGRIEVEHIKRPREYVS